ncbi:MAG TPA: hypothetical protein VG269_02175 [Tepidisphaeraceae bacterium]|nr:hypothetical protein [Tepidisphaeraceae bacterium]
MADVLLSAGRIAREPERLSATAALERLELWRAGMPGMVRDFPPVAYESPQHLFRVKFEPDFGLPVRSKATALHLWNTMRPELSAGAAFIAL